MRRIGQKRHPDRDVEVARGGSAWRARNPELGASIDDGWDLVALHEARLGWVGLKRDKTATNAPGKARFVCLV